MQITPLRDADRHVTGYVFATVDITPSHRSREALIDTGLALSRTIDLDRVFQEVGHQLQRAVGAESFAVLLAAESDGALTRAYSVGYDEAPAEFELRVAPLAAAAIEKVDVVTHTIVNGIEVAAPMRGGERTIGAMTMSLDGTPARQTVEEAQRVLATLAAQTAVAIERAWLVRRVGHKRRLEAIGEVASGVAHELRNPLFGISSAAQLLRFRSRDDPVVEKNVGRILREVERLNRMVTSLLDFGRPRTAALLPGDPDAVWDDVLEGQRALLESRALTLQSHPSRLARHLPPRRRAAGAGLHQRAGQRLRSRTTRKHPHHALGRRCRVAPGAYASPTAALRFPPTSSRASSRSFTPTSPVVRGSASPSASASSRSIAARSRSTLLRNTARR